jgi:hypothetical protein
MSVPSMPRQDGRRPTSRKRFAEKRLPQRIRAGRESVAGLRACRDYSYPGKLPILKETVHRNSKLSTARGPSAELCIACRGSADHRLGISAGLQSLPHEPYLLDIPCLDNENGVLFVQDNGQQRLIDLDFAVVFDEPQLSEFVHEEIHAGTRRSNHAWLW